MGRPDDLISRAAARKVVELMICPPTVRIAAAHDIDDIPAVDAAPVEWFEGVIRSLRAKGREEYADAMQIILDAWEDVIG